MSETPVSRGKFLRSLGKSIPGFVLGAGVASAARAVAGKLAPGPVATSAPPPEKHAPFISSGRGEGNSIAITFDDGPSPGVTEIILDELKKRDLHATFFMIGSRVVAAPELARRVAAEGHEIGNHTFNHLKLTTLSDQQVGEEIQKTQDTLGEIAQSQPSWLRPPYGAFRANQSGIAREKNLGIVLWSVDSRDWSQPGATRIVDTVLSQTKSGSIILCHDLHPQTAQSIPQILDGLLARGFNFVTLSTLIGQREGKQTAGVA
jgi:peptidoglycan/xylan/chitin deacetylase (PgdA/CDA1 family)